MLGCYDVFVSLTSRKVEKFIEFDNYEGTWGASMVHSLPQAVQRQDGGAEPRLQNKTSYHLM